MAVLQEYKCPCCGGAIAFDSGSQRMKCPYCDTEFEMEVLAAYDSELQNETPDDLQWKLPARPPGRKTAFAAIFAIPAAARSSATKTPQPQPAPTAAIPW